MAQTDGDKKNTSSASAPWFFPQMTNPERTIDQKGPDTMELAGGRKKEKQQQEKGDTKKMGKASSFQN
jgi:hypothetical protein